eukprot:c24117_g17_i1 orf=213-1157(+)
MASVSSQPPIWRNLAWWRTGHICKAGVRFDMQEGACGGLLPSQSISWGTISLDEALTSLDRGVDLPSVNDFIHILQKCRANKNLISAQRIYSHARRNGLEVHKEVGNYLVPMFVECGSLTDAQQMFDRMAHRNVHSWTSLISGYVQSGQSPHALNLYQKMQEEDVYPNSYTLVAVLKACKRLEDVQGVHVDVAEKGFEKDLFVGSSLIDVYAKYGAVLDAHEVFNKLPGRNIVSWTALIAGYAEHGYGKEALRCLERMASEGVPPDIITYVCSLKACGCIRAIDKGQELHAEAIVKDLEGDVFLGSTLVDMYAK